MGSSGETHGTSPALEFPGGYLLRILPVTDPGEENRVFVGRNPVEKLSGIVILCEIQESGGGIEGDEMRAVECTGEVLGCGAAERRAGVDGDDEEIHVFIACTVGDGDSDEVGTLVLQPQEAVMTEVGGGCPFFEIRRGEDSDFEGPRVGCYHDPVIFMPCYLGVTELGGG